MQRSTPQPDDFDARQQARQAGLARPKPPRVIVSGDEAEDASEWEVVVVENEAIDDERALEIARQRHQQQRLANLPSLDERDIAQALGIGTEGEAEAADGIDSDAFVLPDDTPPARRIVGPAPMPVGLIFDGVEEPGEESPGEDASAHFTVEDPPEPESLDEVRFADPDPDPEPDGVDPELAVDLEAGVEPAAGDEQHLPVTSWNPAPLEPRVTFDDVDLGFYDIGDEAIDAPVIPDEVPEAAPEEAAGLDRDDETVPNDDPHHDFYAVDDKDPVTALEPPKPKEVVPPTEPVKLWGTGRAKQVDGKVYAPGEVPPDEVIPEDDDDFASSFPIDPDEFLTEEGAEVDVNELDYASVFGPVDAPSALTPVPVAAPVHDLDPMEVAAHAPITESPARRRRRKAAAVGATASGVVARAKKAKADEAPEVDQFEDLRPQAGEPDAFADLHAIETDDTEWGWRDEFVEDAPTVVGEHHPDHIHASAGYAYAYDDDEFYEGAQPLLVDQRPRHIREDAEPRRGRRELLALGAAALVVLAVGVGSQVFNSADRPELVQGTDEPTTTIEREKVTTSTSTTLSPFGTGILTVPDDGADGGSAVTTRPPRTTTTVKKGANPPPVVTSTSQVTTTTEPAPTTTEPPPTTTEPPPTTTTVVEF